MSKQLLLPADHKLAESPVTAVAKSALGDIPPSLKELYDRDPLSLTRPELNAIVEVLRQQRKNFTEAESEAKNQGRRVNAKKAIAAPKGQSASLKLLLEDL